jgi:chromosome partitioning protein
VRTIAVISLKGGSGKTTVAAHLALAAQLRDLSVMVADTDPQRSIANVLSARGGAAPKVVATAGPKLLSVQMAATGLAKDLLIIDTAAGAVDDVGEAVVLCDLALLVSRPTLLDVAGLAPTLSLARRLGKPTVVVINQAPPPEDDAESPLVKRMLRAFDYMKAPLAPVILRSRAAYQTALETGRSVEETPDAAAAAEIAALWDYIWVRAESAAARVALSAP